MKVRLIILSMAVLFLFASDVFAAEGHEHKGSMMGHMKEESSSVIEVGNSICPVSGEKVGGMGPVVQHEYKGKIYNFCCAGCVATFKKDPEKYVKIVEEQMGQHKEMGSEHGHEGQHHVMGEKDENMMMEAGKETSMMEHKKETMSDEQKKEFKLEAYQFSYSPDTIVVNKGDVVKIHATSRDVPHGVFIKEYGINEKVEKGKVKDIEFVADKAGEFDIICSIYCGRGHHSMKAKFIVQE